MDGSSLCGVASALSFATHSPSRQPPVVHRHKRPSLRRAPGLYRIVLDVDDCPSDVVLRVEKDFPARPAPDWMDRFAARGLKHRPTLILKALDHFLRPMAVLADRQMHMIRHDRTRIAGITVLAHRIRKAL